MSAHSPLLDRDQIASLFDALGEDDLRLALSGVPDAVSRALRELHAAAGTGDLNKARRAAHALNGFAGNFGAIQLAAMASEIELATVSVDDIVRRLPGLVDTAELTLLALSGVARDLVAGAADGSLFVATHEACS